MRVSGTDTGARGDEGARVGVRFGVQVYAVDTVQRTRARVERGRAGQSGCAMVREAHVV